jgi:K(+)-stimulated pyrophosphate-energized sodium pump
MREDIMSGRGSPDYNRCIEISTNASLKSMVAPGMLVLGMPLVTGYLFGA